MLNFYISQIKILDLTQNADRDLGANNKINKA